MPSLDSNIHVVDPSVAEQNAVGWMAPRWFLIWITGLGGLMGITFVPWAIWATMMLLNYQNIRDTRGEIITEMRSNIAVLQQSRENHALQLQAISATRFTAVEARALNASTDARLDRIDGKLESLQRDFDRTIGKKSSE